MHVAGVHGAACMWLVSVGATCGWHRQGAACIWLVRVPKGLHVAGVARGL